MSAPTKERSDAREIQAALPMSHIRSYTPDLYLCGTSRDASKPTVFNHAAVECVVCESLFRSMPALEQWALSLYWKARG